MVKQNFSIPRDTLGHAPDGTIWTGEVQAVAFVTAASQAQITVPGRWLRFYATQACHIVIEGSTRVAKAHLTEADRCYPIPATAWTEPIYIPDNFDSLQSGSGNLYISVIRNSADGTLYIAQAYPDASTRTTGATSTTSTTTSTTT